MNTIDALVVGAGPAGLAAAAFLARSGVKVRLLERHHEPGGKACGGGVTAAAWPRAGIDLDHLPNHARAFDKLVVQTALGSVSLGGRGPLLVTIDRKAWTRQQIGELRALGVDVRLGERLLGLEGAYATTNAERLKFGVMVAADGAASRVRKHLGLGLGLTMRARQIRIDIARARRVGIDVRAPRIWFDTGLFGSGYAWAFPACNELRLGCGASVRSPVAKKLKEVFTKWVMGLGLDLESGQIEAGTIGCGYMGYRFGRVFLAGDAAGLASPLTGEGIGQALVSGEEVAKEIVDSSYRSRSIAALSTRHHRTHDILLNPPIQRTLLSLSPVLLRVPFIRQATFNRYIFLNIS